MAKKDESAEQTTALATNDAWTGLLIVAFLSLCVATGFLAWDYLQYSDQPPPKTAVPLPPLPTSKEEPKIQGKDQPKDLPNVPPKDQPKDPPKDVQPKIEPKK